MIEFKELSGITLGHKSYRARTPQVLAGEEGEEVLRSPDGRPRVEVVGGRGRPRHNAVRGGVVLDHIVVLVLDLQLVHRRCRFDFKKSQ